MAQNWNPPLLPLTQKIPGNRSRWEILNDFVKEVGNTVAHQNEVGNQYILAQNLAELPFSTIGFLRRGVQVLPNQ